MNLPVGRGRFGRDRISNLGNTPGYTRAHPRSSKFGSILGRDRISNFRKRRDCTRAHPRPSETFGSAPVDLLVSRGSIRATPDPFAAYGSLCHALSIPLTHPLPLVRRQSSPTARNPRFRLFRPSEPLWLPRSATPESRVRARRVHLLHRQFLPDSHARTRLARKS